VQQVDDTDGNVTNHVTDYDEQVNDVTEVLSLDDSLGLTTGSVDSKTSELRREQLDDETLAGAFDFAKHNEGGYLIKNGLLIHRAKICENTVERLVVPKERRKSLLELAHEKLGCHLACKKTKERIGLSFMWPTMNKDVIDFSRTCAICQKRAPIRYLDRVPIEGGEVSTEPVFSHFYADALGPLLSQKVEYNYCIVFLDHASI